MRRPRTEELRNFRLQHFLRVTEDAIPMECMIMKKEIGTEDTRRNSLPPQLSEGGRVSSVLSLVLAGQKAKMAFSL